MKTSLLTALLMLGVTWANAQSSGARLAVVNGEVITEEQVQKAAGRELENLELKRFQFEANLRQDKSNLMLNTLEEMLAEKLIAAEAMKRSMTGDQLVRDDVDARVPIPSDEAVEKFWAENQARINMTRDQALPQIRQYLRGQDRERVFFEYIEKLKKDYAVESYFEPARTDVASQGHPALGPAQAPVTIVEFSDFECPFCGTLHPTLKEIEKTYGDKIRVVYRQFPLNNIHPNAQKAAEASLCANDQQKFWQLHDAMFTDQRNLGVSALKEKAVQLQMNAEEFNACLDSGKYADAVRRDIVDGAKAGVSGTPAMFVNGRFLSGAQPYQEIARVIEDELRRAEAK